MNFLPEFKKYLFSPPRVDESSESRRDRKPLSKITVKNYVSDILKFINWLILRNGEEVGFEPKSITSELVEIYKKESSSKFSPSSLERQVSSLRKFFSFLVLEGVISESPLSREAGSRSAGKIEDPYRLKNFKNYLYVSNASKLTIKNYLMDVRKFIVWLEEVTKTKDAWDMKEKDILGKMDANIFEEYKLRLSYSPRTINRKLSSLRKYFKWAKEEGLIPHIDNLEFKIANLEKKIPVKKLTPSKNYSFFPPLRLIQKSFHGAENLFDLLLIAPLAYSFRTIAYTLWKLKGKPILLKSFRKELNVKNISKNVFAPLAISIASFPIHRKLLFHIQHTRPKWYKIYHSYPLSHYFHIAILMVFMSALGVGLYQNMFPKTQTQAVLGFAFPQTPPRILSFQGRLTDSSDNPITSSTNLRFGLYDSPTGTGSALIWQEINTVTPDSDGVFSLLLGNRSTMGQDLFAQRAGLWLGVTVGQTTELTPRQRLATVAYAENADNLQGLPPITQSGAGTSNVVLALDSSGNLTIGGTATPTFQATGGQFTLSGNPLLLTTAAGSKSNVTINPDGRSFIDLQKPLQNSTKNNNVSSALGAVEVDSLLAVLATSSGQSAFTVNQNGAGPILSASSSGTAKFTVSNAGDITAAGGATLGDATADDIAINGRLTTSFIPKLTANVDLGSTSLRWNNLWVQTINTTGTNTSGQATFTSSPATTAVSDSTVFINPTTASADVALLGIGVAGAEKARIDAEGDLILSGAITAPTSTNTINSLIINAGALSGITTIGMSGQLTSTLATGTAPFVVSSTTNVVNLNASSLSGATFAAPGAIGGGTAAAGTFTTLTANTSITDGGLTTAGVVLNSSAGLLSTLAGTTTTVLHGNASGAPTFASISGSDLASNIAISTTGNIATTGSGTITSAGLLTASNGLTLTTGALNLTATSGSTSITGYGTTSLTSTTVSGNILSLADTSFTTTGANLANLTFTNTNAGAGTVTTSGLSITPTGTAITGGGSNTLNAIDLPAVSAIASNTFNGLNIGTGYNNLINSANFTVAATGVITAVGVNSGTGLIQGTGGITVTGTGNINATGTSATNIGNSTGALVLASGGTSSWTNTSGNLTIQTATSGTLALDSAGALNIGNTNATSLSIGRTGVTTTNNGSLTSTQTLTASNGLTLTTGALSLTSTSGNIDLSGSTGTFKTSTGANTLSGDTTIAAGKNLTLASGTGIYSQTFTGTTTNAFAITANSLTSGNALNLSTNSTAALTGDALANLSVSGANGSGGITRYGLSSSVTSTGGTSTNVGIYSTASGATNNYAAIFDQGSVGINSTAPGAQLQINTGSSSTVGQIIKGSASQSVDLLQLKTSLDAVIAKVDQLGNITGNTLTSSVAQGTAPLTVTSTTVVANLNAAAAQEPMPNLVLNSDFGRRNKWMTFMPEVFADTNNGLTVLNSSAGSPTVSANVLTPGTTDGVRWLAQEGLTTWKDARFSGQIKWNSGLAGIGKTFDVNNMVIATIEAASISIWKRVGGTFTQVTTTAFTPVAGNTYWVELEAQGTTYIAKFYSTGGTTYVAKSSATLSNTITATITDAGVASGGFGYWEQRGATVNLYGGLSTGDGGVYVEGWGPESWDVTFQGTLGGQAIGFDETADAGPLGKQWAVRSYIPATSRGIQFQQTSFNGAINGSTSYTSSVYEKVSGLGGSGALFYSQIRDLDNTTGVATDGTPIALTDSGETSYTRKSSSYSSASDVRGFQSRIGINYSPSASAAQSATGTVFFLLPQFEQGAIATPWRNAPADDDPIVWELERRSLTNISLTNTASSAELDPRDLAANYFLPWDATVHHEIALLSVAKDASSTTLYVLFSVDGDGAGQPYAIKKVFTTNPESSYGSRVVALSAGKHRATAQEIIDAATVTVGNNAFGQTRMTIRATRGKGTSNSSANDLAEEYSVTDPTIEAGDVVKLSSSYGTLGSASVERVSGAYNTSVLGVISTAPAITFGNYDSLTGKIIDTSQNRWTIGTDHRPVALSGRVSVKVTNENGPVKRGDILTSSEKYPGYAMRATRAGKSIGIAMDDLICPAKQDLASPDNERVCTGKIMTFVNLSWYDPDVFLTSTGDFVINKVHNISQVASATPDPQTGLYNSPSPSASSSASPTSEPNCQTTTDSSNFGLISSNCPQTVTVNYAYQVTNSLGNAVQRIGSFSQLVVGTLKAGLIQTQELVADNINVNNKIISPIAEVSQIRTDIITPLASNKIVIRAKEQSATTSAALEVQPMLEVQPLIEVQNASGSAVASIDTAGNVYTEGNLTARSATVSGQLSSKSLNSEEATISGTLKAKNIIADNITSDVSSIKYLVSSITDKVASLSGSLNKQSLRSDELTKYNIQNTGTVNIASYSAMLANVDTLNANVGNFSAGLFAVGPTSLSDATVFGQLAVGGNLILADSSINVLGQDLKLQPLGQGGILLGKKIYIDTEGNLTTDGNATIKGTLFAGLISPIPGNDLVFRLGTSDKQQATSSGRFVIQNASGSAVASIDSEGNALFNKLSLKIISPALALSDHEFIATGSAGIATVSAHLKEVTILDKLVTDKSLIYITPVGTSSAVPFLLRQKANDLPAQAGSFTVGISSEKFDPTPFNWLIIN